MKPNMKIYERIAQILIECETFVQTFDRHLSSLLSPRQGARRVILLEVCAVES